MSFSNVVKADDVRYATLIHLLRCSSIEIPASIHWYTHVVASTEIPVRYAMKRKDAQCRLRTYSCKNELNTASPQLIPNLLDDIFHIGKLSSRLRSNEVQCPTDAHLHPLPEV